MAFNSYQSPPRRYHQANEAGWVQNLLGKTLGGVAAGTQLRRIPLVTRIIATSSMAAMLAQPIPNLLGSTLKPAVAHSLNLEAGTYSITGADLTPAAARTLDLEVGTYAVTGADATTLAARTLNLEAGTYALTGADLTPVYVPSVAAPFSQTDWRNPQRQVTFHHPTMFRPAQAAPAQPGPKPFLSQEWANPTLRPLNLAAYGYTVRLPERQPPFSQINWPNPLSNIRRAYRPPTMFRPEKAAINDYSLNLESGTYAITGADAVLAHSGTPTAYDLNLEAGTYVVTGADLTTLAARTLNLEVGSYATTGADLTVSAARVLNLEAGSYALTGADLTALVGRALNLEVGTYTITGVDAELTYSTPTAYSLNLEAGSYTITGAAATLQGPSVLIDGDEVQVLIAPNGIACTVLTDAGTTVKVVISSTKQIHVVTEGGTPVKVII